jgi:hypothetical protein
MMAMMLQLPADLQDALTSLAQASGLPLADYLESVLRERVQAGTPVRTRAQVAGQRIRELRKNADLGGISIKDLIEEGRE